MSIAQRAAVPLLAVALGVTGGLLSWTGYSHARHTPPAHAVTLPSTPSLALTNTRDRAHQTANELGRIPIIEYHSVGDRGAYDANGLNIAVSVFRAHLESLHKNGFYPVNLRDILDPAFTIPAGKSPVVITFDDARSSQLRYLRNGSIDPTCAVGILNEMHRKYGSDWPQRATFFVLPGGWEPAEKSKMNYLVKAGYEVANHSTTHHSMRNMDDKRLTWESENCRRYVQKLAPGATMDTFALPYGVYPTSKTGRAALVKAGNRCLVKAWGDASRSPFDKRFDTLNVDRIVPAPGHIESWISLLSHPRTVHLARYVSDGDPTTVSIPPSHKKWLASVFPAGQRLVLSEEPSLTGSKSGKTRLAKQPSRHRSPRRTPRTTTPLESHARGTTHASTTHIPAASDKDAARRR